MIESGAWRGSLQIFTAISVSFPPPSQVHANSSLAKPESALEVTREWIHLQLDKFTWSASASHLLVRCGGALSSSEDSQCSHAVHCMNSSTLLQYVFKARESKIFLTLNDDVITRPVNSEPIQSSRRKLKPSVPRVHSVVVYSRFRKWPSSSADVP
ncbi:hypothetical protein PoB_004454900 [Plakobranchus ocellatus]|uniref:Uncharacterized protein n=1 Tax=Plakobranchus ocellatus TaxID=259542 RepID=A0AAV4BI99_9GAST|nr:hypothetical protein PoB_004454900 [Plakobranchus ocellatus]